MKTNLFFVLVVLLLGSLPASAQYTDLNAEVQHADISLMDWDNDGDLDLLISGATGPDKTLMAYTNNGAGTFTAVAVPFTPTSHTSYSWNDINQDGKPDLLVSGFSASVPYARLYTSDGAGVFSEDITTLPQTSPGSGFADFNNDGYIDIYVFGNDDQGKSKILFNDKNNHFIDQHVFDTYTFKFDPDISVIDFDNDKDLDLFISAGEGATPGERFSRLFANNNGVFTEFTTFVPEKGYGSSVWGDYDGDGFLDLLLNGSGTPADDFKYKLYKNNGGTSFTEINSWIYGQFSVGDGGRFLDWDNDGDLDFAVTGWTGSRQATAIYLNSGGIFTEAAGNEALPGVSESSIEVGDVDNDADLDLIITGFSGNDFDGGGSAGPFNKNVSLLFTNPATNTNLPPSAPTNIQVTGTQASVNFSWSGATDATTPAASLSYNMYLIDDQGKTFIYPAADIATGRLLLQKTGNAQLNTGWIIRDLPPGNYQWGVQAVDNSFAASPFVTGSFTVTAGGPLPVTLAAYQVKPEGSKARIEWTTALEHNNDHFDIYRSADGITFIKLETVKAKGSGSGQYLVYDNNPSSGVNYYRLVQSDVNGQAKDHGIKTITFNIPDKVSVITFPNPATSQVGIRLSNYKGKLLNIKMSDMSGRMIHSESIAVNNSQGYYTLSFKTRPVNGQYILNVSGVNLKETLKVLIK